MKLFTIYKVGAVLVTLTVALVSATGYGQQPAPDPEEVAGLVVRMTNEFRAQEGRGRVEVNARLTEAARYFAAYMAKTGQFGHEADGSEPATRAKQHGYDYCIVSENIAYRYSSAGFATRELAQGFVDGWKQSPGHRQNMLDPDVTQTGAAIARGTRTGYYHAVQMFGRPASQSIRFSIANRSSMAVRYRIGGTTLTLVPRQTRTHTQCRSQELRIDWPGKQRETTITPKDGDRFAIVGSDSGGLELKTE